MPQRLNWKIWHVCCTRPSNTIFKLSLHCTMGQPEVHFLGQDYWGNEELKEGNFEMCSWHLKPGSDNILTLLPDRPFQIINTCLKLLKSVSSVCTSILRLFNHLDAILTNCSIRKWEFSQPPNLREYGKTLDQTKQLGVIELCELC